MFKNLLIAAGLLVAASAPAWSQAGQFPSGWVHGNAGASAGQAQPSSVTSILDRALGSTRGSILERGSAGWSAVNPSATAGLPWVSGGTGADPLYQLLGAVGGGTGNAFFQVSGPASSIKTYTFPNANSTMAALATIQIWTGAQSFTDSDLVLLGASSGSVVLHAPATGGVSATFFSGTDTVAGLAATQTLTNKTLTSSTDVLGGVTMMLGSDATGDIYYRNSSGQLTRLPIGSAGNILNVSGGLPVWTPPTGGGNVSNSGTPTANQFAQWISATQIQGITQGYGLTSALAVSLTNVSNSLGSDVSLSNTSNYFDGPSTAQGTTGTWKASGTVTLTDTAGAAAFFCKLWDGTTVIASASTNTNAATVLTTIALSGILSTPAANIRISCRDATSTSGTIKFNISGNSKDSTLVVYRIQ